MKRHRRKKIATDFQQYATDAETQAPRRLSLRAVALAVSKAHLRDSGASIHSCFGDLTGQALYSASLYPERTVRISGSHLPTALIVAFYKQNADLLGDLRLIVGTWYNTEEDTTYMDVAVIFMRQEDAVLLARAYNQWAIYDLARENEIAAGGTGEDRPEMPVESQRLPPFRRGGE